MEIETNLYNKVKRYENCTVEILTNTITGEQSIGWWQNDNPPIGMESEE